MIEKIVMIGLIAVAALSFCYMIYVLIKPNNKSITQQFRGDDEKYE